MRVLGIDPGIAIVGYSILDYDNNKIKCLEYGCITTSSKSPLPDRLSFIYNEMNKIIDEFQPEDCAFEELFFNKNVKTAITVSQARGVEILSCINKNLNLYEYTPLQIKQAVVGYGRADKRQVQEIVKTILKFNDIPKPDDAADAVAVALCHIFGSKFKYLNEMK
ncbi:crossover junction endodeoxyribonuclease RuvC [Finegoldia magna]|uniref:crossover junction endodeoxyribonuclease RuvC n=1 Tax=Finegoldia magna TaxID=1260 RepID=UPI000B915B81|nr:crossover junction endodeoxyribonuclease RuvC [Finegoldia magna]OXZ34778.1 crossover junction endodeoxyribonuclease RuvC [Finegoldia magna]